MDEEITINSTDEKRTAILSRKKLITVGMIDIKDKIKEALTNTRVHPEMGESLPAGGASFDINILQFVSSFNSEEGILLKNLPDGMLTDIQRQIKQRVIEADIKRERN